MCWLIGASGSGCGGGDGGDTSVQEDGGTSDGGPGAMDDAGGRDGGVRSLDAGPDGETGGDAAADGGAVESTPIATYCSEGATRYYDWLQQCFGEANYLESDRADYVGRLEGRCMHAERAVDEGRLRYDGEQATRCLAAMETEDCIGSFFEDAACDGVFAGLVPPDGDCFDEESRVFLVGVEACADGYCGGDDDLACPGRCVPWPERGDSCDGVPCGPADYCDEADRRCRERRALGDACAPGECEEGLTCHGAEDPTCVVPAIDEGGACDDATPCIGGVCIDGQCRWHVEAGQRCVVGVQCPDGTSCSMDPEGDEQVCVVPRGEGESCIIAAHCMAPLVCVVPTDETVGTCEPDPAVLDEPCDDGRCAEGLWCSYASDPDDGVCEARVGEDEECAAAGYPESRACVEGLFCTEEGTCAPPGAEDEPCNVFETQSCVEGLYCSRDTGLCAAPAGEDAPCNPFWSQSCAEGLGCACGLEDRDACGSSIGRGPVATDTCQPRLATGEACFRDDECESLMCQFDFDAPSTMPGQCSEAAPACLP